MGENEISKWDLTTAPDTPDREAEVEAIEEERKELEERKRKEREAKLNKPSIDDLPPPDVEVPLSKTRKPFPDTTHAAESARTMEKRDFEKEERLREAKGLPPLDED